MKLPILAFVLVLAFGAALAPAQTSTVPTLLSYQGRVTDAGGVLIGNTTPVNRTVQFKLYSASSGGTALWAESQTVTISGGEFSVLIGNGTGISGLPGPSTPGSPIKTITDIINVLSAEGLYLGVAVSDGTATTPVEISPRQRMVVGAYAVRSRMAETVASGGITETMLLDGAISLNKLGTGAVNSAKIADGTITSADILAGTIASSNIATGAITAEKINGSIGLWATNANGIHYSAGRVGIGQSSPGYPLSFADALGDKISLFGQGGSCYGLGIQSNQLQIHTDSASNDIVFGYGASASMTETLRIKGTGNVGIGTNSPGAKLDVRGAVSAAGVSGHTFNSGDTDGGVFSPADGVVTINTNGAERLRVEGSGALGLGTNTPNARLHLYESTGIAANYNNGVAGGSVILEHGNNGGASSIMFRSKVNAGGGDYAYIQYQDNNASPGTNTTLENAVLSIATSNDADDHIALMPAGYVGIKTITPTCPLDVRGYANNLYYDSGSGRSDSGQYYQEGNPDIFSADGSKTSFSGYPNLSMYAEKGISAQFFLAHSDQRIKDIVSRSDAMADLKVIRQLQVTDYRMKDSITSGPDLHKGLVAQEVEKVIPGAVNRSVNYIPDVYQPANKLSHDAVQQTLTLNVAKPHHLKAGDWVRIFADKEVLEIQLTAIPSATSITVAAKSPVKQAFVYGRRVNDFLAVDYDRIFTTGISAIQQLAAEMEQKEAKIAELEDRLKALEGKDKARDEKLAAIEKALLGGAGPSAQPVSLKKTDGEAE